MSTMSELDRVRKEQARLETEAAYCEQALEDAKTELQESLAAIAIDAESAAQAQAEAAYEERRAEEAALADQRDIAEAQAESNYEELQGEKYLEQIKDADTVVEPTELF